MPTSDRTIILIHGRATKPPADALFALWRDGLRAGIERDHPAKLQRFKDTPIEMVYFGDISNDFFTARGEGPDPDPTIEIESRRRTFDDLADFSRDAHFDKKTYKRLPGRSGFMEGLADIFAGPLGAIGLAGPLIGAVAPDMIQYWNPDAAFCSLVRERMILPLGRALAGGGRVCVIAHSLGSLITYDTLWKFTHAAEYRSFFGGAGKVDLLITIGSPLGDTTARTHLKGARASGNRRYPHNITRWVNLAARDDYICHDERLADDYMKMVNLGLMRNPIEDHRVYNLAVRNGKSNPHHAIGYLIHPVMADTIAGWLDA